MRPAPLIGATVDIQCIHSDLIREVTGWSVRGNADRWCTLLSGWWATYPVRSSLLAGRFDHGGDAQPATHLPHHGTPGDAAVMTMGQSMGITVVHEQAVALSEGLSMHACDYGRGSTKDAPTGRDANDRMRKYRMAACMAACVWPPYKARLGACTRTNCPCGPHARPACRAPRDAQG
jgi:hypothetical protein